VFDPLTISSPRVSILEDYRARIEDRFGKTSAFPWFRQVKRGPWRPGNQIRPTLWVVDDGQESQDQWVARDSRSFTLRFKFVLDLLANWENKDQVEEWTDRVQKLIIFALQERVRSFGMLKAEYVGDDPVDVVLQNGPSEQVWIIEFTCDYFQDITGA